MKLSPAKRRKLGVETPCLICRSSDSELWRVVKNGDSNTDRLVPEIAVSVCRDCGLIYQNPCLPQKVMDGLYEKLEDKATVETDTVTESENQSRVDSLKKLQRPPGRLLEIGCSDGTFLALAAKAGYSVEGMDPSAENVKKAAREHPHLKVRRCFLTDFPTDRKFDVIAHFFVLEHSFQPEEFLAQVRALLKPGGLVFFEIPNAVTFGTLPFANNLFTYQHTGHYSPATVRNLLSANAYETIAVDGPIGLSPKSYGMRVACRPAAGKGRIKTEYKASAKLLRETFARKERIIAGIERKVKAWLPKLKGTGGPVVIFGASENGRILAATSLREKAKKLYFCDNNAALHGRVIEGIRVLPPKDVPKVGPALAIATSIDYQSDMVRQLVELGVPPERCVKLYPDLAA